MTVAPVSSKQRVKLCPNPPAAPVTSAILPSVRRGQFALLGIVLLELFIFKPPAHKSRSSARFIQEGKMKKVSKRSGRSQNCWLITNRLPRELAPAYSGPL